LGTLGCVGEYGVIFGEQLLGYPWEGTQNFPWKKTNNINIILKPANLDDKENADTEQADIFLLELLYDKDIKHTRFVLFVAKSWHPNDHRG